MRFSLCPCWFPPPPRNPNASTASRARARAPYGDWHTQDAAELCDPLITHLRVEPPPFQPKPCGDGLAVTTASGIGRRLHQLESLALLGFTAPQLGAWLCGGPLSTCPPLVSVRTLDLEVHGDKTLAAESGERLVALLPGLTRASFAGRTLPPALGSALARGCQQLSHLALWLRDDPASASAQDRQRRAGNGSAGSACGGGLPSAADPLEGLLLGLAGAPALVRLSVGPASEYDMLVGYAPALLHRQVAALAGLGTCLRTLEWECGWSFALLPAMSAALPALTCLKLCGAGFDAEDPAAPGQLRGCFPCLLELCLVDLAVDEAVWNGVLAHLPSLRALTCAAIKLRAGAGAGPGPAYNAAVAVPSTPPSSGELEPLPWLRRVSVTRYGTTRHTCVLRALRSLPGLQRLSLATVHVVYNAHDVAPGVIELHGRLLALSDESCAATTLEVAAACGFSTNAQQVIQGCAATLSPARHATPRSRPAPPPPPPPPPALVAPTHPPPSTRPPGSPTPAMLLPPLPTTIIHPGADGPAAHAALPLGPAVLLPAARRRARPGGPAADAAAQRPGPGAAQLLGRAAAPAGACGRPAAPAQPGALPVHRHHGGCVVRVGAWVGVRCAARRGGCHAAPARDVHVAALV